MQINERKIPKTIIFGSIFDRNFWFCYLPASDGKLCDRWERNYRCCDKERILHATFEFNLGAIIADNRKQYSQPWHKIDFKTFNPNSSYRFQGETKRDQTLSLARKPPVYRIIMIYNFSFISAFAVFCIFAVVLVLGIFHSVGIWWMKQARESSN